MWKWLHPFANPQYTYRLTTKLVPWLLGAAALLIGIGTVWGLAFAPPDYQQGDGFRIIYWHVPAASLSLMLYVVMASAAFIGLIWQYKLSDWFAISVAPIGCVVTLVALFTGAVWGKPMWGTWWVWDARLTSELILLFLYFGVVALYQAIEDKVIASRAATILILIGVVNIPIIKFSVEWWHSLHQGATLKLTEPSTIDALMFYPLLLNFLGFFCLCAAMIAMRFGTEILERNMMRSWAKDLLLKGDNTYGI